MNKIISSKFLTWLHRSRAEEGQAMVMVALSLVVMLGFGAFAVDLGHVAVVKSDLPKNTAPAKAVAYANLNGMDVDSNDVEKNGEKVKAIALSSTQLQVTCSRQVDYYFAGVLGFKSKEVTAVAVAEKQVGWEGESLPFINIGFDYSINDPTAWTKVGAGIKGTIYDFRTLGTNLDPYFEVEYSNGITIKPGFANGLKGLDGSTLKTGLSGLITKSDENIQVVYLFSLRAEVIKSGEFTVNNGTSISLASLSKLKNGDVIDPNQLVLIQCLFVSCDNYNNQHSMELKYLGNVYDLGNTGTDKTGKPWPSLPDFPSEFIHSSGNSTKLVL